MLAPPICLIDLDGVIAPHGDVPPSRRAQLITAHAGGYMGDCHIDRAVTGGLAGLHNSGVIRLEWCTGWEEEARDAVGPLLGAPYGTIPVHLARDQADSRGWFKLQAVLALLDRGQRVIWCDDEIERHAGILNGHPDLLAVCPPAHIGLTIADVRQIEQWARRG